MTKEDLTKVFEFVERSIAVQLAVRDQLIPNEVVIAMVKSRDSLKRELIERMDHD